MIVSGSCFTQKTIARETCLGSSQSRPNSQASDSFAIGVRIIPGVREVTEIFVFFRSLATDSAKPIIPHFEAQYAELLSSPFLPEPEETKTIVPSPRLSMSCAS